MPCCCHRRCSASAVKWPWHITMSTRRGYIKVIKIVITIEYSIFNDVDPSHIILFDCCMRYCRGCCPVAAVGRRRPPLPIDATIHMVEESSPPAPFPPPSSPTATTHSAKRCSLRAYAAQRSIQRRCHRARWLLMPTMMLVLTSPEIIANPPVHTSTYS